MKICLDMDGVLVDFVGGAATLIGYDPSVVNTWDYYPLIGKTENEFWRAIDAAGSDFWATLPIYPWALDLYRECKAIAPTIFLTSPSQCPSSMHGKLRWMQDNFGRQFRDYLVGPKKEFCATPDTILIDDSDANCKKFQAAGGRPILFPRPWNENRGIAEPYSFVLEQLDYHRSIAA
jgi:5'(3')-deoxyribonucleotidase